MWGEFCKTYAPNSERKRKEQVIYNNTASYLNKAVQELKKINCKCTEDNVLDCDRCAYIDDIRNIHISICEDVERLD